MTAKGNYKTTPLGIAEALNDVALFHRTFGHPILEKPAIPPPDRQVLRSALLRDEYLGEFDPAWVKCAKLYQEINPKGARASDTFGSGPACVDALADMGDVICDLIYYLLGTSLEYGIPLKEIWQEVQKANMAKLWTYAEAEVLPVGWTAQEVPAGNRVLDESVGRYRNYTVRDETGKVRKPPSWKEPDVKAIIQRAMEEKPDTVTASNLELAR